MGPFDFSIPLGALADAIRLAPYPIDSIAGFKKTS
jgi:hypothetical protein